MRGGYLCSVYLPRHVANHRVPKTFMGRLSRDRLAPGVVHWNEVYDDGPCWENMRELMVQYGVEVAAAEVEAAAAADRAEVAAAGVEAGAAMGGDDCGGALGRARGRRENRGGEEEWAEGHRFHRSYSPE